ncbi:hypothetical protein BS47DRAFT_1368918 [Hydnum rufescens UP504]|uniref:CxC1-like cysteine cluster associated with KDZ transposases domain-containing protein n=1 Tax=Hydnum rufescens UP504 TaxID=1448309 RepID=A0A9P6AE54_9AGAM|nr:hypothetical protein BS47DRAFT_1368918 [Hydnum rufescens UP504]
MKFWREQHHSSSLDKSGRFICKCSSRHHTLEVTCVHMERIEDVVLDVCECRSAPVQLVQHGFFPCTLVRPTLARLGGNSYQVLEDLWLLFRYGDSFCCRFANALAHYQQLVELIDAEVEKLGTVNTVTIHDCPSIYLQSRCPLCFGCNNAEIGGLMVDSIVCIDANFQLKRQRDLDRRVGYQGETGTQDPHITSPRMIELSQEALEAWEQKVQGIRPGRGEPRAGQKHKAHEAVEREDLQAEEGDKVERNLNMPNSTYRACGESFIAADGDQIKALTQYFSDTGVLAMLCRHDIPIFMANMWTAGEKQFYVFALLDALIKHLPHCWRIGALYDIGCQIDQSLKKWDFLPEWSGHLEWGVLIFHAYGHQWTCQLWYHPRKNEIWGLSDGEGCEWFWSELRQLIPGLQVTGYHCRLFLLDLQVEHIDEGKREGFGKWLRDHTDCAQCHLDEAQEKLGLQSIEYLLQQFKEQRLYHSQPISRQSQTQGAHAIDRILSLQSTLDAQQENLQDLIKEGNDMVGEDSASEAVLMEWQEKVKSTKASVVRLENNIQKKVKELKLRDQVAAQKLSKLKKDKWITLQLNLCVLREQLLRKLDVDQDIWEDTRGDVTDFPDGVLPPWLADALIKQGICTAQEIINCKEELEWCKVEHSNLWTWFSKEYTAVERLVDFTQNDDVSFFALVRLHQLYDWGHKDDGLSSVVSSDDDDDGELEEDCEVEDLGFIALIDSTLIDSED